MVGTRNLSTVDVVAATILLLETAALPGFSGCSPECGIDRQTMGNLNMTS